MLNTHITEERGVPLWAMGVPAIGVPLMVALLALTAPSHESPADGADPGAPTEQLERHAADQGFGLASECAEWPSSS